jgi:ribosomal protein L11 methyltransferase
MLVWRKLSSEKWLDSWEERLAFLGWDRLVRTQFAGSRRLRLEIFDVTQAESAILLKRFGGEIRDLRNSTADWVRAFVWKAPISIRGRLRIINREPEPGAPFDRKTIYIPANLAFGTGEHATTAACLRLLTDIAPKSDSWDFLDAGTGTGILAIAAMRLGAGRILAFDFDRTAVRIAKANARLNKANGLKFLRADALTYTPDGQFDIIAANLYTDLFRKAASLLWLAMKPQGNLIVSGLTRDQIGSVDETIREIGGYVEVKRARGKWVTLLARKNSLVENTGSRM